MKIKKSNNSISLGFLRETIADKRYWILLSGAMLMLLVGQNVTVIKENNLEPWFGKPEIPSVDSTYQLEDINSRIGEKYRLLFQVEIKKKAAATLPSSTNSFQELEKINIIVANDLGTSPVIATLDVPINADDYINKDVLFTTDGSYKYLVLQKGDRASQSEIYIKNVRLVEMKGTANLQPSLTGYSPDYKTVQTFGYDGTRSISSLFRKNAIVGQTFIAENDTITGVNLKLSFFGNGGGGYYTLFLREADTTGEKKTIGAKDLAQFVFDTDLAESIYQSDPENGIYHFPLLAELVPGKEYILGVDNSNVSVNLLNNLQIFGSADRSKNPGGMAVSINSKQVINSEIGDFYTKLFYVSQPSYSGEKVNFGDTFDDLGDGTGLYTYNGAKSLSALDPFESGADYKTYKINSIYPYKILRFEYDTNQNSLNNIDGMFYSFDNSKWQEVLKDEQSDLTSQYRGQIQGDGANKVVYLKINKTVDPDIIINNLTTNKPGVIRVWADVKVAK